ncbi:MAG: SDR family NAD(P)-dependent oxidoreductase [Streptosporangiales bacterium]|nr:SDR family NAD(P)-dependent oxidoreductase [Streptosporangiales bacterium]
MKDFAGRVAVVTGAASGIGRALAEGCAGRGMKVVLADVEPPALDAAVRELRDAGHEAVGVVTDVSQRTSVQDLVNRVLDEHGKVHLVFNNAGVEGYLDGTLWEATAKDWQWTMGVNFWGVVYGVQAFLPIMLAQDEEGHMVNTGSTMGVVRGANMYGVAKHAVVALTETVYGELQQRNAKVGISVLCPGMVHTRLFQGSRNRPAELRNEVDPPGATDGEARRVAMNERLARAQPPAQVADLVLRAISEGQFYIFTDHAWDDAIRRRSEEILARQNPTLDLGIE